jgi:20S proteasome alpha/beta subunit
MTIIVAARLGDGIVIGADSLISTVDRNVKRGYQKLFQFDNFIIGACGGSTIYHILADFQKFNRHKKAPKNENQCYKLVKPIFERYNEEVSNMLTFNKNSEDGTGLIIATRDKMFVSDEFSCESYDDYCCIGSGESHALGALYATYPSDDCIEQALRAAIVYDSKCGTPIFMKEVK